MLKLTRLKIEKYRNVRPTELVFNEGHNILLGKNGTGKTTLLNLISNLLRLRIADLLGEELAVELELRFEGGSAAIKLAVTSPAESETPAFAERARDLDRAPMSFSATAAIVGDQPDTRAVVELSESLTRIHAGGKERIRHRSGETYSVLRMIRDGLPWQNKVQRTDLDLRIRRNLVRLDESLQVLDREVLKSPAMSLYEEEDGELSATCLGLTPAAMEPLLERSGPSSEFVVHHHELPALAEVVRVLEFREAQMRASLLEKELDAGAVVHIYGNLRFLFTRRDGSIIPLDHLSYGQKRLLTFYLYLDANPDLFIADELVNGLHHGWIEECMKAIGARQSFLTSQNPLLLDYLWFESREQVKRSFVLCRSEPAGDREALVWTNMSDEEADMFYAAYQVGLQKVGEILKTRGLW